MTRRKSDATTTVSRKINVMTTVRIMGDMVEEVLVASVVVVLVVVAMVGGDQAASGADRNVSRGPWMSASL